MDSGTGERYYLTDLMFVIGAGACQVAWWASRPFRRVAGGCSTASWRPRWAPGVSSRSKQALLSWSAPGAALLQSVAPGGPGCGGRPR